jgi:hypothetical protein
MKKWMAAITVSLAVLAWGSDGCQYHTVTINGRTMTCATCCWLGVCNTRCN